MKCGLKPPKNEITVQISGISLLEKLWNFCSCGLKTPLSTADRTPPNTFQYKSLAMREHLSLVILRPLLYCLTWIKSQWTLCSDKNKSLKGRTMWQVKKWSDINYVDNINLDLHHSPFPKKYYKNKCSFVSVQCLRFANTTIGNKTIFDILFLRFAFNFFWLSVWFQYLFSF